jgi:hypothetical protein
LSVGRVSGTVMPLLYTLVEAAQVESEGKVSKPFIML